MPKPFFNAPAEPDPQSPEGAYVHALVTLIEAYERKHFPTTPPDPIDAIKFRTDQGGMTPKHLEPLIGQRNRVYEVLGRKRPLTLAMIRRLSAGLGIPAQVLIGWGAELRTRIDWAPVINVAPERIARQVTMRRQLMANKG